MQVSQSTAYFALDICLLQRCLGRVSLVGKSNNLMNRGGQYVLGDKFRAGSIHVFTALGGGCGMLALERAFAKDYSTMFGWLALALLIDGVDGTLARRYKVKEHLPHMDGDLLDGVIDFMNYVIVPLTAIWTSGMMSPWLAAICIFTITTASALYFADTRMKTSDYWFRGFPALWNVLALYFFAFPVASWIVFSVLMLFCAAMFAPVTFVHPVRVVRLRLLTITATAAWLISAGWLAFNQFEGPFIAKVVLALVGIYYFVLALWRSVIGASGAEQGG